MTYLSRVVQLPMHQLQGTLLPCPYKYPCIRCKAACCHAHRGIPVCFIYLCFGSIRQAKQHAAAAKATKGSAEFQAIYELVLNGQMSAAAANKIALAARIDDANMKNTTHPEMGMLATAGSEGAYPNNVRRDLDSTCLGDNPWPRAFMLPNVPVLDRKQSPPKVLYVDWPIFLLQDLLHWLYTFNMPEFQRRFIGSSDHSALRNYWQAFHDDDPRLLEHPVRCNPDWMDIAVPGRVHADGVPYGKGKLASADVANVSSILAAGDTMDTLNLWWWLPKSVCTNLKQHGVCTRRRLWKAAVWDLICCLRGEFLPWDWYTYLNELIGAYGCELARRLCLIAGIAKLCIGHAMCGPWCNYVYMERKSYRDGVDISSVPAHPRRGKIGRIMGRLVFAVIQAVADTEYHANQWGLKHWQNKFPCDFCWADAVEGSAYNFSDFRT